MVTITDPRHPLFGRTLPLIHVTNRQDLGRCCVIRLQEGIERNVPLEATDHSAEPITIFPLPLDISSMRQLLVTSERILTQLTEEKMEEKRDGSIQANEGSIGEARAETANTDLDIADTRATASYVSDDGANLSRVDETLQRQSHSDDREDRR